MMFGKLKKPCKTCPFIAGGAMNQSLGQGRMEGIQNDLMSGKTFTCHKTIDYRAREEHEEEYRMNVAAGEQHCVGAMLWLQKRGKPNQAMQVGERLGFYKPSDLQGGEKIIE